MEMSMSELKSKYMRGMTTEKEKEERLELIADLNGVEIEEARDALIEAGVPEGYLPSTQQKQLGEDTMMQVLRGVAKMSKEHLEEVFRSKTLAEVITKYDPRDIKDKFSYYMKLKEIEVGDIVRNGSKTALVTYVGNGSAWLVYENGRCEGADTDNLMKTGKKVNFEKISKAIGG